MTRSRTIRTSPVAILTGTGGQAFCAGADLKEIASVGLQSLIDACTKGFDRFTRKQHVEPWIAAVNGFAMGGGTGIRAGLRHDRGRRGRQFWRAGSQSAASWRWAAA